MTKDKLLDSKPNAQEKQRSESSVIEGRTCIDSLSKKDINLLRVVVPPQVELNLIMARPLARNLIVREHEPEVGFNGNAHTHDLSLPTHRSLDAFVLVVRVTKVGDHSSI